MNSRSNKKSRSSSNRGGRGKGIERQLPAAADGVYGNHRFMQVVGAMVGLPVMLLTKTKEHYEGVFTTFGPNLELVLDLPHLISSAGSPTITNPESIKKKIIFAMQDVVYVKVLNVDLEYATKESFAVDSVISKFNGQVQSEKELEPWHGEETVYTDLALGDENAQNGWDADDMFKKNEEKYGVTTTYSPEMEGYTTPLQKKNTKEWKEQEAKAQQIALEIEHSPMTQTRAEVENGEDEEEKFSAVIRPDQGPSGGSVSGKYMPPQRRKIQDGRNNKQLPRGTPSPQSSVGAPSISNSGRYNSPSSSSSNTTPYNNSNNNNNSPQSSSISISASVPAMGSSYNSQQNQMKHHQHKHTTPQPPPMSSQSSGGPGSQQTQSSGAPNTQYHSMQADTKLNGDPKDSRRIDNPHSYVREPLVHKESYHPSEHHHGNTHPHHPQIPHHQYAQQTSYQSHSQSYHASEKPMSREPLPRDPNPPNPREQREPRKSRNQKEEQQIAELKKFGQDFKLSEPTEKKISLPSQQQHPQPPPPTLQQPPPSQQHQQPSQQQHNSSSMQMTKVHHSAHAMPPPPAASQPPPQIPQQHTQHQVTSIPPQHHKSSQPDAQQVHSNNGSNIPPTPQQQQRQQSPPQQLQHPAQPQPQPTPQTSNPQAVAQEVKPVEEENPAVLNSKLNPNAKEFILNPNAKPFNPRSPSTTTPPRVQTPQIIPTQSQIASVPPTVGYQQNIMHYVMAQPFPMQTQPRFPKRGPGSNQRTDYASSMQVAAATGHPILAPAPLTSITNPQSIPTVPMPQNMMAQTPQPYSYQQMSMMFRMAGPPAAIPMVTTVVPTSMGMYYHGPEGHQNSQGHTPPHMYVTSGVPQHQGHQPHPVANPGPHPGQPPTPQGHASAGGQAPPPNMPTQPPTPGPTPPQAMMYSGPGAGPMGGQPTIPQHLPQHSPHTQSPHNHYSSGNAALAAAAAAAASGHHPATQLVMLPPHLAHMMPPGGGAPPPHSGAGHVPSSATGYTPTSSAALQHMNHGHPLHYIPGTVGNAVHPIPLVHHNQ